MRFYDARAAAGKLIETCRVLAGEAVRFCAHDPGETGKQRKKKGEANLRGLFEGGGECILEGFFFKKMTQGSSCDD